MELQKLDVLALKVEKALEIISDLKNENSDLHEKNRHLLSRVEELEATADGMNGELNELRAQIGERDTKLYDASNRLENLLRAMDSIEIDSDESQESRESVYEIEHEHQPEY